MKHAVLSVTNICIILYSKQKHTSRLYLMYSYGMTESTELSRLVYIFISD